LKCFLENNSSRWRLFSDCCWCRLTADVSNESGRLTCQLWEVRREI